MTLFLNFDWECIYASADDTTLPKARKTGVGYATLMKPVRPHGLQYVEISSWIIKKTSMNLVSIMPESN
jgi:hypothetical protein